MGMQGGPGLPLACLGHPGSLWESVFGAGGRSSKRRPDFWTECQIPRLETGVVVVNASGENGMPTGVLR